MALPGRNISTATPVQEEARRRLPGWSREATASSPTLPKGRAAVGQKSPYHAYAPSSVYRRFGKRPLDLALGALLFVGVLPIFAVVAVAVLVSYGWPVLYLAQRVGKDGQSFRMWKFRTMVRNADAVVRSWKTEHPTLAAEYEQEFKIQDDPRIIKLGRVLRASSIDELPQLWNVLRGEMSLVGPRPVTQPEVDRYGPQAGTLLSVRPGMTGRWQVGGRNAIPYQERISLELDYCRSVRLVDDARILLRSLTVPLRYDGR